jgi:hypothetical protein
MGSFVIRTGLLLAKSRGESGSLPKTFGNSDTQLSGSEATIALGTGGVLIE